MNLRRVRALLPAAAPGMPSRRDLLRSLASTGLGLGIVGFADPGEAQKKRKRKKRKKKIRRNTFGCVDVGNFCKNGGQCCSGICQGKKGKKKCQGHDEGSCQANQDSCSETPFPCITSTGESGVCTITTGKAPYCNTTGACFPCRKDADCVPFCGPHAACMVCATQCGAIEGFTACVGPSEEDACGFPE
jgi:hypothetical protein